MFKKMTALMLCLLMLMTVTPVSAFAAETATYTVETRTVDSTVKAGDIFTITVSISPLNALSCIECKLRYDKTQLKPLEATKEGFLAACFLADSNIAPQKPETTDPDRYGEIWITGLAESDRPTAGGTLTTITFEAVKDITDAADIVIFKTPIAATSDMTEMVCVTNNGGIRVNGVTPPDAPADIPVDTTKPVTQQTADASGNATDMTATDTDATTVKQNSIQAPAGNAVPMETTTVSVPAEDGGDHTAVIIVFVVIAVAAAVAAAIVIAKKKKA